jgi:multiple sugar transport system permease protein
VSAVFLLPWAWLISTSFKPTSELFTAEPTWIPQTFTLDNYRDALTTAPFFLYLRNTLVICGLVVVGKLISSSMVGYGFARIRWAGQGPVFLLVLATMMLPFQVTIVPLYIIFSKLHWINSVAPLTVPAFFGDAFFIFLMRQFLRTIPFDLSDAARIDGAGELVIFARVILPLARPALTTVGIFSFLWTYTDFQGPLIFLQDSDKWTLSLGLLNYVGTHSSQWGALMAASVLFTIPVILLFFFAQKAFIQGIATTGLK